MRSGEKQAPQNHREKTRGQVALSEARKQKLVAWIPALVGGTYDFSSTISEAPLKRYPIQTIPIRRRNACIPALLNAPSFPFRQRAQLHFLDM
jgi:hypothetical protein